jgi:adenylate cyclase
MAEEGFKRKLTAILSADVVGYSRLMEDNEEATIQTLNTYRNSMSTLIQQYRGRVVDTTGDNLMAEFSSVVDAVKCAVKAQKEMGERNAELPENRRMLFRIGVNLGDIVEEGDRIYGDGVNIAARLEGMAEAGGICISRTAYGQVKNRLELGYEYLGEHSVKNISEQVHIYRVLMEPEAVGKVIGEKRKAKRWMAVAMALILLIGVGGLAGWYLYIEQTKRIEPVSEEKMAFPLPDKPSIAVLPFVNISGNPEQEYFSDGITEQIITALSKSPDLFVISRSSTFTYKGKSVKVQSVSQDLGVRYVVEGSVQKAGDKVRITAQLIDAKMGQHLWAEYYDRELKDIFALQDEITIKIMQSLQVKLLWSRERGESRYDRTKNLESYLKMMKAWSYFLQGGPDNHARARRLAKEANALDPEYSEPYIILAWNHMFDLYSGASKSPRESMVKAYEMAQKILTMDASDPHAHELLGDIYAVQGDYDKAIAEFERAIALDPNYAGGYMSLGYTFTSAGRPQEAIPLLKKSMRLSPLSQTHASMCLYRLGRAYRTIGQYNEALSALKEANKIRPKFSLIYMELAATYIHLGREEEARAAAAEILKMAPKFSLEPVASFMAYKNPADQERYVAALRKAGLK